ncbi:MAG: hypothetical protein JRH11_26050 [Deltaproteobacteria bacterium]|nr:hypothetical protein [Deltaproteobacteria bacterium]
MIEMFLAGGPSMWVALLCSMIGNPLAIAAVVGAFVTRKRGMRLGLGIAAVCFGLATLFIGGAGYMYGMSQVASVLPLVDPGDRELIQAVGQAEAMNNIWLGLCGSALPLLFGTLAIARGAMTKPDA